MKTGVGYYAENLRRLLTISGGEGEPAELAPELVGAFVLENDRPEWGYLRGEKLCWMQGTIGAALAVRSGARIVNPVGSGILAVVEYVFFSEGVTEALPTVRTDLVFPTPTAVNGEVRDRRRTDRPACTIETEQDTNANLGGLFAGLFITTAVTANRTWGYYTQPIILPPGQNCGLITGGDNESLVAGFSWRERALRRYEL